MDADDAFVSNISRKTDVDTNGYLDVIAHGTPNGIQITHNGQHMTVDHRTCEGRELLVSRKKQNWQKGHLVLVRTAVWICWAGMNNLRLPDMNNRETFKLFSPRGN